MEAEPVNKMELTVLGLDEMDRTHEKFIQLVKKLRVATDAEFKALFHELHVHTEMHFAREFMRMKESNFPALMEHHADHQRILGELVHFGVRVGQGRLKMARAFICEQLPDWFTTHLATMDSALVAHFRRGNV